MDGEPVSNFNRTVDCWRLASLLLPALIQAAETRCLGRAISTTSNRKTLPMKGRVSLKHQIPTLIIDKIHPNPAQYFHSVDRNEHLFDDFRVNPSQHKWARHNRGD